MKIGGVDPKSLPNEELLIIPRGDTKIVFRARGLQDLDEFDAMVPSPRIPTRMTNEGIKHMTDDKNYVSDLAEYNKRRMAYIVVKSLEPSEIEWDTVKMDAPSTWANW